MQMLLQRLLSCSTGKHWSKIEVRPSMLAAAGSTQHSMQPQRPGSSKAMSTSLRCEHLCGTAMSMDGSADGQSVSDMTSVEVESHMRGPTGSSIVLTLAEPDAAAPQLPLPPSAAAGPAWLLESACMIQPVGSL